MPPTYLRALPPGLPIDPATGPAAQVPALLLGLGPGLTPAGDDVLAGALVALRSAVDPAADALEAAVPPPIRWPGTSTVSAALLGHAALGECIPELAHCWRRWTAGRRCRAAVARLRAVGDSSGAALIAGVRLASCRGDHVSRLVEVAIRRLPGLGGADAGEPGGRRGDRACGRRWSRWPPSSTSSC